MNSRVVSATEFKAKCLALLDEIDHQGGTITVTKRGRPMAMVGPVRKRRLWKSSEGIWAGKVHISEEELTAAKSELWEAFRQKMGTML
ncbi:MAG: type II toxin-antitoxin system prevent-host-death family antitoxin [Bryobacteraceae bacterium]|jgi:prevent-host-death family protein